MKSIVLLVKAQDEMIIALAEMVDVLSPTKTDTFLAAKKHFYDRVQDFQEAVAKSRANDGSAISMDEFIEARKKYANHQKAFIYIAMDYLATREYFSDDGSG